LQPKRNTQPSLKKSNEGWVKTIYTGFGSLYRGPIRPLRQDKFLLEPRFLLNHRLLSEKIARHALQHGWMPLACRINCSTSATLK
jgi:hypothetical protein